MRLHVAKIVSTGSRTREEKKIFLEKITIPSNYKMRILRDLRLMGVRDSTVYPSLASRINDMLGKKQVG